MKIPVVAKSFLIGLAVNAAVLPARADMMDYRGTGRGWNLKVYARGTLAHNRTVRAGELNYFYEEQVQAAYCVDLYQAAGDDGAASVWNVDMLANGALAAHLYLNHAPQVAAREDAAALQVAIWEVVNETPGTDFDVTDGFFSIRQSNRRERDIAAAANNLLYSLPLSSPDVEGVIVLHSDTRQDVILPGAISEIPEPFTMATLALGAVCLLLRRRAHPVG